MISFTKRDCGKRDILNNYNIDQRGTDTIVKTIHAVIMKKYQKYPSSAKLKHVNIFSEVNPLPYVSLLNVTPWYVQYYIPRTHNNHIVH